MAVRNPFALQSRVLGRLAGWVMGRYYTPHRQVAGLLAPVGGATLRGCGGSVPGHAAAGSGASRAVLGDDQVELRPGTAGALTQPDGGADYVVAVNAAAIWPDLTAGLREMARGSPRAAPR